MDILIVRPDASGIGGLIALILLLALLAGEYYLLTTRDALLQPTPEMVAQAAQVKKAAAAAELAAKKAKKTSAPHRTIGPAGHVEDSGESSPDCNRTADPGQPRRLAALAGEQYGRAGQSH